MLGMFFLTQLIGLLVIHLYAPIITQSIDEQGNLINITSYNLPYGVNPPEDSSPKSSLFSILIAIAIAVFLILFLMKIRAEIFLRIWFLVVVFLALSISINAFLISFSNSSIIALIIALPLALLKIFRRSFVIHNLTELLIYPGIAAIFVPLLNVWTSVLLMLFLSVYDIYAVWKVGFMQKMAKYQMEKVKVFPGFFVPYLDKKAKKQIEKLKSSKSKKPIKLSIAILGGGDVVFPLILAGAVFNSLGFMQALIIILGATAALGFLFYISKKGKAYPAMPFITIGVLFALGIIYFI